MTVCIAGITSGDTIVAMADMMVSTTYFSSDNMALKFHDLHADWKVIFAGNDVGRVLPLMEQAAIALSKKDSCSLVEAEEAMRQAFQKQLIQKQTDLVLARYGLRMEDFLKDGLSYFGESLFTSIKYQLDQIMLDCSFLVYGYDVNRHPHIFTVEDPGIVCNHDLYGFWAIGSGANRALSSLFFRNYNLVKKEWMAIYLIAEAKFMAEGGSVGEDTLMMVMHKDGSTLGSLSIAPLKELWVRAGQPKTPPEARDAVAKT